jgi:hypothetical protein
VKIAFKSAKKCTEGGCFLAFSKQILRLWGSNLANRQIESTLTRDGKNFRIFFKNVKSLKFDGKLKKFRESTLLIGKRG